MGPNYYVLERAMGIELTTLCLGRTLVQALPFQIRMCFEPPQVLAPHNLPTQDIS